MDYIGTAEVLRALVRTIEADAIPAVSDQYVRSQLWATTGILGNLANELDQQAQAGTNPAIGDDLGMLVPSADLEASAAAAAALVRENLATVVRGHATLHYRRAVAGFD